MTRQTGGGNNAPGRNLGGQSESEQEKRGGQNPPHARLQADELTATGLHTIMAAPLTTQFRPAFEPLRVKISARDRLEQDCQVMIEQTRAFDRIRFGDGPLTSLTVEEMAKVEKSLKGVLGLL
jgi:mRNA interferase MazF